MIVAGIMSGTSADGINVAIVRMLGSGASLRFHLLGHSEYPYPAQVRSRVLAAMNATSASVADLSRLNFLLSELYADAVRKCISEHKIASIDLIGCHGQTIYHQGEAADFLGRKIACSWQTGEGAVLAARLGVPVVSDFRPADMAAGGKGAPLVPLMDYVVYKHGSRGRILQNIGGICHPPAIPARGTLAQGVALHIRPRNMLIYAVAEQPLGKRFSKERAHPAPGTTLA